MAESVNGGSNTPAQPPKEMSMEVRLLIAFLLMGAVMFVTPYIELRMPFMTLINIGLSSAAQKWARRFRWA